MSNGKSVPEGYRLVWEEQFDGDTLNSDHWSFEVHEPGWVNEELQEYRESPEYAYVKDGKLVIQPVKVVDENGKTSYISGRINTLHKKEFLYGWVEARLKVPKGRGFLPAFWMMPADEEHYGQWPKCGEIDIMEVLGHKTDCQYATIHYGEPHEQQQGSYTLQEGDFADEYHVFACKWEPDMLTFYVDGKEFHAVTDWFTAKEGEGKKPYPAPFDQPFYIILNVAVGGVWPGDPDETTPFDEAGAMMVDYVRVYQKISPST